MIAHNVVIRWYNHHTSVIHPTFQLQVIYSKWCTQCCHQVIQSSYISNTSYISSYKLFIQNDCTQCCHQVIQSSYISNTSTFLSYKLFIQNDCTQCCHQVIQSSYISNTSSISNYKLFIQNDRTQCCHQVIQSSYISNTPTFLVTSYLFKMIAHNVVSGDTIIIHQ